RNKFLCGGHSGRRWLLCVSRRPDCGQHYCKRGWSGAVFDGLNDTHWKLLWLDLSRSPDDRYTVRTADYGLVRKANKQTMLYYARNARNRMRQRNRIVNPGKCRVKNPVTTIRDKSMSIL